MVLLADASFLSITLHVVAVLLSLLLMLVVLIQRGKGGGLIGAFGGVGGSSPFGSRAGDAFTKFTLYLALAWAVVIMFGVKIAQNDRPDPNEGPILVKQGDR